MSIAEITLKKIKMLRELHNYTQQYVSLELDLSQNAYSLLEKGSTKLTLERLEQIAKFYKVDVTELISDKNEHTINFETGKVVSGANSNFPPSISPLEKILYEKTIHQLENNIARLYDLIGQITRASDHQPPSTSSNIKDKADQQK